MGWKLLSGVITIVAALVLAAPAQADNKQDQSFLSALTSAGWSIKNASGLIAHGQMVCNEGLAHGVSWQEMRSTLISWGYSQVDASTLITKAVSSYCPHRKEAIANMDTGTAATGDYDDMFVRQLERNQGIKIDKAAALDMAKTACTAPALAGPGWYNAFQSMKQRYPSYGNSVANVMAQGILAYCPERLP